MSAYADTSALRRLLVQDESRELLENYLREQDGLATCDLTVTELHRVEAPGCCRTPRLRVREHGLDPRAVRGPEDLVRWMARDG